MSILRAAIFTTLLLAALVPAAGAHASQTAGTGADVYRITWGLQNEPATTWQKTGLDLIIVNNATRGGVPGLHHTLNATLIYLEDELTMPLEPQHGREQEGRYTFEHPVTLTRGGLYSLRVEGTINGTAVNLTIPAAHPYHDIEETFFPEAPSPFSAAGGDLQAEIDALQARIAALEAQADAQATQPADVVPTNTTPGASLALALAGVAVVALALGFRRRA